MSETGRDQRTRGGRGLVRSGRPEAAAAIWSWQAPEQPKRPKAARLRWRGAIQAGAGFVAGSIFWSLQALALATVALTVASIVLLSALLSPTGLYSAIDRAFHGLGQWIGRGLTWLLLPALFYLVFTPFGMLFRRGKKDTMKRFFESGSETYWSPHRGKPDPSTYERQF